MKLALNILGVVLLLGGAVATLSGLNLATGAFAVGGHGGWAGWGAWMVAFGAGILVFNNRHAKGAGS